LTLHGRAKAVGFESRGEMRIMPPMSREGKSKLEEPSLIWSTGWEVLMTDLFWGGFA
jgi:hypothetical protein